VSRLDRLDLSALPEEGSQPFFRMHDVAAPLRFEVMKDFESLAPLKAAWQQLCERSDEYYSARGFDACKISWETVARPRRRKLHCIIGYRGARLVLIWPFVLYSRSPGLRVAQPLGPEATEYATVLVDDGPHGEATVLSAIDFLMQSSGCNALRVELVRPESVLHRALARSKMMKIGEPMYVSSTSWEGISTWEEYASRWNAKERRRRRRNLEKTGAVTFEVVRRGPGAVAVIDWLLARKLAWMTAKNEKNVWIATKEFRDYLMALANAPDIEDGLTIFVLKVDGRIVAADLCFVDRYRIEGWVTTYDLDYSHLGVGRLLMEDSAKWAFERRLEFDQRLSEAEYKKLWTNRSTYTHSYWCTRTPHVAAFFIARLWAKRGRDLALRRWAAFKESRRRSEQAA